MNNHYAKFEYKGMKSVWVTDYTDQTPSLHSGQKICLSVTPLKNKKLDIHESCKMRCTSSICEQSLCKVLIKMNENFWSYRLQKLGAPKVLRMDGRTDRPQGGTLICFCIRRLGPSIYPSPPKKYQKFQVPPKNIWNFCNPKKYPDSVYLP